MHELYIIYLEHWSLQVKLYNSVINCHKSSWNITQRWLHRLHRAVNHVKNVVILGLGGLSFVWFVFALVTLLCVQTWRSYWTACYQEINIWGQGISIYWNSYTPISAHDSCCMISIDISVPFSMLDRYRYINESLAWFFTPHIFYWRLVYVLFYVHVYVMLYKLIS